MSLVIKTTGFDDYLDRAGGAYMKALILGLPDAGKTRSASFWPSPIFADCEKGRMSIADRGVAYGEVRSAADMDALLEQLRRECQKGQPRWQTFVVDTLDSYQRILINERLMKERKEALSGWQDWGYLDGKMMAFIEKLLNLPMNIVVNLHVKTASEDDASFYVPKLKGDIRDSIMQEFDFVGFMEQSYEAIDGQRERVRQIRWHAEPKFPFLKDRSGQLPEFTEVDFTDQDFYRIFNAVTQTAHVEEMPITTEVETLEVAEDGVEPAAPDDRGGPIVGEAPAVKKAPAKKAAVKKAAKPGPAAKKAPAPEPEPEPLAPGAVEVVDVNTGTDVSTEAAPEIPTAESAEALLAAELDATVVDEVEPEPAEAASTPVDEPVDEGAEAAPAVPVCGDQPDTMKGKHEPVAGCGRSLAGQNRDRVNVAVLRTKTMLCEDCFGAWKAAS